MKKPRFTEQQSLPTARRLRHQLPSVTQRDSRRCDAGQGFGKAPLPHEQPDPSTNRRKTPDGEEDDGPGLPEYLYETLDLAHVPHAGRFPCESEDFAEDPAEDEEQSQ